MAKRIEEKFFEGVYDIIEYWAKQEKGGRTKWYCEHPEKGGFLGYGGNKYPESTKLQTLKTHPKWCPRNKEKRNEM